MSTCLIACSARIAVVIESMTFIGQKERQMRRTAVIVGALFWISNLATVVGSVISGPIPDAPNSLTIMYPHGTQVLVGTLIAHINDAAIIG